VAYIDRPKSKKLILADRVSERKIKVLLTRMRRMAKGDIERLAKD